MEKNRSIQSSGKSLLISIGKSTAGVVFLVTILITLFVHLTTNNFYTVYNLSTLIRQVSFTIIVAFGQTLVLISGGIDLSVASIAAFCSMSVALLMTKTAIDPFLAILISLLIGLALGAINGWFIHVMKLSPFIVTLATGAILKGIVYVVTKGMPLVGIPEKAAIIGQGELFKAIPYPALIMFGIFILLLLMLKFTPFGRHIFAIGGNENAANIVGVRIGRVKILTYALSGLLASSAGVVMVMRLASSQVNIGENWVMPSVTAAILGGTSMSGGSGGVSGTIVGGLLMGVIATSITLTGVSSYWETIVTGGVVLIAVSIDAIRRSKLSA